MRGHPCGLGTEDSASADRRQCERNGTVVNVGHRRFTFGFELRIRSRECGAPKVLLCFVHCWHAVGKTAAEAYLFCSFRKEECCSMRVHLDRKQLDGAAIAFVVITLLTVIAFAILLSRLNAFF
jgi:hypothetical protein